MQLSLAACLLAACVAACGEATRIVFPSRQQERDEQFATRRSVRRQVTPPEDYYDASDYADKIIFLNRNQPNAFEHITAQNLQRFSIQLDLALRRLNPQLDHSNVVFSPVSIASVLALVLLASEGRTRDEVSQVLGLGTVTDDTHLHLGHVLGSFANSNGNDLQTLTGRAVFLRQALPVSSRFLELRGRAYNSDIYSLDFANDPVGAQILINRWVAARTNEKIVDLLPEPPISGTKLILASALYFNGAWLNPFIAEATRPAPFRVTPDRQVDVLMMSREGHLPYARSKMLDCAVVGLPYKTENTTTHQVSMFVVLPNKEGPEHLDGLKHGLFNLPGVLSGLVSATKERSVVLVMPRLKVDAAIPLVPALKALGLHSLFDPAASNLSALLAAPEAAGPLHVDEVRHRVALEVTETGTEAAAATSAALSRDGFVPVFKADRPFLFFIYDHASALPLFWGSIHQP